MADVKDRYSASDYPVVVRASEAYSIARGKSIKAQQDFDATSITDKRYDKVLEALNAAKAEEAKTLKAYKSANAAAKAQYNKEATTSKATSDVKSAQIMLNDLNERKKKAEDTGESTVEIDAEIKRFKKKIEEANAAKKAANAQTGPSGPNLEATSSYTNPNAPGNQTAVPQKGQTPALPKDGTPPKGGKGGTPPPKLTDVEQRAQALETAGEDFELPETIFNNVDSLKTILDRYVKEDWTESKLRKAIRDDVWFRKNSKEIKARYVQLYNYEDLVKTGQIDPNVPGNTQYEQDIASLERQIADKARAMGSGIASDPDKIRLVAQKMYLTNQGIDDPMTVDFIAAAIRPIGSTIAGTPTEGYSGQALKDYQAIQGIAKANGFRVKDIVPGAQTEQQVLQGIATGAIDPNRLAQDARKLAAQGQPQYVRDLLSQGYNLDQVFQPYRQTMANILEINPDEIDLNDQTLRSAITDKGDMNIYDFKKTLKADNRWQYTENAKQEVSDVALQVLRDFGFQG
jgi:hypothetical protein